MFSVISSIFDHDPLCQKVFELKRLSSTDSASLLSKLTANRWRPSDIKENIKVMSAMKNNPLAIHRLATLQNEWQCKTLSRLVEHMKFKENLQRKQQSNVLSLSNEAHSEHNQQRHRQQRAQELVQQFITNRSAQALWRRAHGRECCDFNKMFNVLAAEFAEFTASKRRLESRHLISPFLALGMSQSLSIDIRTFDKIYDWFHGMTRTVEALEVRSSLNIGHLDSGHGLKHF